jgi:RHS repeat-associated protein
MWGEDIIQLMYDVPNGHIQVWKFEGKTWMQQGKDIPLKFADGDVFTIFAGKDGTVEIRRNGKLLTTRQLLDVLIPIPTPTVTETPEKKDASVPELVNYLPVSFNLPAPQQQSGPVTIDYVYDPLYRLTEANYSTGDTYHYTYDAVGNRLTQTTQLAVNSYQYDVANRLASVNGVNYTWDNNGNLLNDGVNTYAYDSANRLTSMSNQSTVSSYQYNGMGDRLQQTVNGNTTTYTLDINTSLPEVLNDGQYTYLYGMDNIAQVNAGGTQYFLGDALNSTRQLTDANAQITLAQSYDPFGSVSFSAGNGQSVYGYTSEQSDPSGLVYLRARYYSPNAGRFTSRDTWAGNINQPMSLNQWNYVNSNSINYTDPSGYSPNCAIKGTCGPDVTKWFMTEMSHHYDYGVEIKNKVNRMKALAITNLFILDPCAIDIYSLLKAVAIEPPFDQIVREFNFPTTDLPIGLTPLFPPWFANQVIDTLAVLEYGLYGLAVDYTNITYGTYDSSCNTGTCAIAWKGSNKHPIISLCNQCRDASDLGNMMFGLGGAARGYSWSFVVGSALLFNKLSGDTTSGWIDGGGAFPGWMIGNNQLFRTQYIGAFCLTTYLPVGRDSVSQIQGCQACNGLISNGETVVSSIVRSSGEGGPNGETTTIDELENKLNGKIDEIFKELLSR